MNDHYQNTKLCHNHPNQILVGVCSSCLHQKLLVVASQQSCKRKNIHQTSHSRKSSDVSLPKIFSFGSLRSRHHNHQQTFYDCDEDGGSSDTQSTSTSLEESFISIKFEDNGIPSWDKTEVSKASKDELTNTNNAPTSTTNYNKGLLRLSSWRSSSHKSIMKHSNSPRGSMRWRKRIGHFLQLVRLKRPKNKSSLVDVLGAAKGRNKGWIMRSLTKRRT